MQPDRIQPDPPEPWLAFLTDLDDALETGYEEEMRSYLSTQEREDLTLDLWIKMIEEQRK